MSYRGIEIVNPVVAQWETGNNTDCQDLRITIRKSRVQPATR